MKVKRGVTRTVFVGRRWAVKVPGGLGMSYDGRFGALVRGWLANRSEWKQRHRSDVAQPVFTFLHLALVMYATPWACEDTDEEFPGPWDRYDGDEGKPSSWGYFGSDGWLLLDFDRAWDAQAHSRGLVGWLYYGRQERLARKWAAL